MNVHGIGVTVEVPKGGMRKGVGEDGKPWTTKMPAAYGRIPRTNGADHEPIDAYIGPHVKSPKVYVVNQNDAESGDFDEHKVFLGFASKRQVIRTYMAAFSDGKGGDRLGRVAEMSVPEFKEWLKSDTSKPHKFAAGGAVRHMQAGGDPGDWAPASNDPGDWAAPASGPDIGQATAAARGLYKGATANWGDELAGLAAAAGPTGRAASSVPVVGALAAPLIGGARLGYEALTGRGEGTESYEKARDKVRQQTKEAEEQYPKTTMGTEMASALSAPVGGALKAGAPLAARLINAGRVGAGYGAVSGAGSGEGAEDTAIRTGVGTGVGALAGPLAVPIAKGAELLGQGALKLTEKAWRPILNDIRAGVNPEREASRAIAQKIEADQAAGKATMTPEEWAVAKAAGHPVSIAELGGQTTRDFGRDSANISPEAWATISEFAGGRFKGQYGRYEEFLRNLVGGKLDNYARKAELKGQAKVVNDPAYTKLFKENDGPLWDDALEHLAQDPIMQGAIRRAGVKVRSERTLEGYGPLNNPFTFEPSSGRLMLRKDPNGKTIYPDLRFWDFVKRELDGEKTPTAGAFAKALRGHLDEVVPDYEGVRAGAAKFFGASNAVDAGTKFATSTMPISEAQAAFAKMTDSQKAEFTQAYFAKAAEKMKSKSYSTDLSKKIEVSPEMTAKNRFLLGEDGHKALTDYVTIERGMDALRTSLGNSTTAKQSQSLKNAINYGLAGGVGGLGGYGLHDNMNPYELGTAGLLALGGGRRWANNRLAAKVAEMLVSDNPQVLAQGMKIAASNKSIMTAFRNWGDRKFSAPIAQGAGRAMPSIQGALPGRADENQPSP